MRPRLYVLVRDDLECFGSKAAQVGHAIAEWCAAEASRWHWDGRDVSTPSWRWNNDYLVILKVSDEKELREWYERFKDQAQAFLEPDLGYSMTAFAVIGKREEFKGLKLL